MTAEKFETIIQHLDELNDTGIIVRKFTIEPPVNTRCKIVKVVIPSRVVFEESTVSVMQDLTPTQADCFLKEIDNSEIADSEFEKYPFALEKVYDAYKNNDFVVYNPNGEPIFKKTRY